MATNSNDGTDYLALHFGRTGSAFGEKFWELASHEHNFKFKNGEGANLFRRFQALFYQNENGFNRARALFIDPDGQDISHLKKGPIKGVTDPETNFITDNEDAMGNFAAGFYTKSMAEGFGPKFRKMVESCDKTPCFLSTVSYSGGCSGVYCRFLQLLQDEFSKSTHINFGLIPSPNLAKSIIDTYNFVISQSLIYCFPPTLRVVFDNEALYGSSAKHANVLDLGFDHVNLEVARVMSLVTGANRLNESNGLTDLSKLIVEQHLNYVIPSYARLAGVDGEVIEFEEAFPRVKGGEAVLASCPYKEVLANAFYTKGLTPSLLIQQQLDEAKLEKSAFENVHIDPRSTPLGMSAFDKFELGSLSNNTGMRNILIREANTFDNVFRRRAYVHWFVGYGMEEGEMVDARSDLHSVINEYPHEGGEDDYMPAGNKGGDDGADAAQAEVVDEL